MTITPPLTTAHGWTSTMRELLLARAEDDATALLVDDESWTWREVVAAAGRRATWLGEQLDPDRPPHVGVLLGNGSEYVHQLVAAMLGGLTVVGLNPTRRGDHLARDVAFTRCQLVLTDASGAALLDEAGIDPAVPVVRVDDEPWAGVDAVVPDVDVAPSALAMLVFTSGTTGAPKAVVCSTGRLASVAQNLVPLYGFGAEDVVYLSMPLFHSGAVLAGLAPSIAAGATMAVAERFSASGFLPDIRRYGATMAHYVGKPLSYVLAQPASPDDADNPLRLAFGNEAAPDVIERFAERFGCRVRDAYSSSEMGVRITRPPETPAGALGRAVGDVRVLDQTTGEECPVADRDADGRVTNAAAAIGEFVNVGGVGSFEGYWDNQEAADERVRDGRFHSGDLGFRDADGWLWFAGRSRDWIRVDGENFGAGQVTAVAQEHPGTVDAVAFAVPDVSAGDQVMVVARLLDGGGFDPHAYARWWRDHPHASPKWMPRYVRIVDELPLGPTNKVQVDQLATAPFDDLERLWWVPRGAEAYQPFTAEDRANLLDAITTSGRAHLLP